MNYTESISKHIKEFRKKHKLTQSDFGNKVDMDSSYISQLEIACRVNIGIRTIIKLCVIMKISIDELVGFKYD